MTDVARPKPRRFARLIDGGWSTGLFVIGSLFDVLCVMNVPGAAVLTGGEDPTASITPQGSLLVLLVFACWGTVFVRARAPLAVLVAGGVLMVIGVSYLLALVGVFSAIVRWPRRTVLIASVAAGAVALYLLREGLTDWGRALAWTLGSDPVGGEPGWALAAMGIALVSFGILAGAVAYRRARTDASLSRVQAAQQHERADALDEKLARQAERERIARDLHDGLGHRLSSMALAAGAFETQAAVTPVDPELAEWARVVRRQAHEALEDVRGVVGGLRSDPEGPTGSRASLRLAGGLLADLRATGHRIDAYVFVESIERLGADRDAAGYRVLQESLTNAIKHAPRAPVSVTLDAAPDRGIRIRVVNPLVSATSAIPGGQRGIAGIRERAAVAGGTAWIGPHQGQFIVDVSMPWA